MYHVYVSAKKGLKTKQTKKHGKYKKEILSAARYIEMITIIKRELTISGPSNADINVGVGEISDQTSTKRLIHSV